MYRKTFPYFYSSTRYLQVVVELRIYFEMCRKLWVLLCCLSSHTYRRTQNRLFAFPPSRNLLLLLLLFLSLSRWRGGGGVFSRHPTSSSSSPSVRKVPSFVPGTRYGRKAERWRRRGRFEGRALLEGPYLLHTVAYPHTKRCHHLVRVYTIHYIAKYDPHG